jgi:hypothetical protein
MVETKSKNYVTLGCHMHTLLLNERVCTASYAT